MTRRAPRPFDLEKDLTRAQKEAILKTRLEAAGTRHPFRVSYDRRFGFNYEVEKGTWASVTFACSITSPKFPEMVKRCAMAINDVGSGSLARAVRGPRMEEGEGES